jgi:VWFA-related protein
MWPPGIHDSASWKLVRSWSVNLSAAKDLRLGKLLKPQVLRLPALRLGRSGRQDLGEMDFRLRTPGGYRGHPCSEKFPFSPEGYLIVNCRLLFWTLAAALCAPALAAGQSPAAPPVTTIRATSDLVVLDVVATDEHRNPVHGLTASDFTLLEDGHAQSVKSFEEHTAGAVAKAPVMPKLPPGVFTNYSPAPAAPALNILLLDRLNTPIADQAFVRSQLPKFLKEARPGTQMAIFGLNQRLVLLQGFTSDPSLLLAAIDSAKGAPRGSALMDNQMTGDGPGTDNPASDAIVDFMSSVPGMADVLANYKQFAAEQQSFQIQLRARYTLDAFNQLARYLGGIPGRKNLIWVSGSFPINIAPNLDLQDPFGVIASMEDEFRETADLLARSQVAVYPIDARGLTTPPMLSAANSGRSYSQISANPGRGNSQNPANFARDLSTFNSNTWAEHDTMTQIAEATGGEAFVNTNGLKEAAEKAADAGSNFYTLTYVPDSRESKGNYRKIQVKLDRSKVNLAYRRGYFADDPNASVRQGEPASSKGEQLPYSALRTSMQRGTPMATEIVFEADVRPSSETTEDALAPDNQGIPKLKGPYRRYTVSIAVPGRGPSCPATPDGVHHCVLEFATYVYDADGKLLNLQSNGLKAGIPSALFEKVLRIGLQYRQEISVPVKEECYLRIGLHDLNSNRLGSLELPVATVSKLPPFDTQSKPSAPAPASTSAPAPAPK